MRTQLARYSDLDKRHKGEHNYIDLLGERVELAAKTAQGLFDRVTTKILAGAVGKGAPPPVPGTKGPPSLTVVPPPTRSAPPPAAAVKTTDERISESPNKAP